MFCAIKCLMDLLLFYVNEDVKLSFLADIVRLRTLER